MTCQGGQGPRGGGDRETPRNRKSPRNGKRNRNTEAQKERRMGENDVGRSWEVEKWKRPPRRAWLPRPSSPLAPGACALKVLWGQGGAWASTSCALIHTCTRAGGPRAWPPVGRGCVHVRTHPAGLHNPSFLSSQRTRVASGAGSTSAPAAPPYRRQSPSQDTESQRPGGCPPKLVPQGRGAKHPWWNFRHPGGSQPMVGFCLPGILSPDPALLGEGSGSRSPKVPMF